MDTLRQDLRFACRSLMARRGFAFVAAVTLALGVGATTAMFSVVRGVILKPLPYPESERIVTVWEPLPEEAGVLHGGLISHPNFLDVKGEPGLFESFAQVAGTNLTVTQDGVGAEIVPGARVTPEYFRVFRADPILGREFVSEEDVPNGPAVAVVSEGYWRERLGGRPDVLQSSLRIGGRAYEIVGVAPSGFDHPGGARIWVPSQNDDGSCGRGCVTRGSVGRLAPGVTVDGARARIAAVAERLRAQYPGSNTNTTFEVATLRDVTVGDVRPALWVLFGTVGMVLLIACANVANLLLLRGQGRSTEIAVRAALGAGRRRILRQLMTENALLALVGGLSGALLAFWGVDVVLSLAPVDLPRLDEVVVDPATLAFALLLVGSTAILFGLAPALTLSRMDLAASLRQGGRAGPGSMRAGYGRSAILVAEVALSVVLLTGAGLMVRSLARMTEVDPGFDPSGVMTFRLNLPSATYPGPDAVVAFMDRFYAQLTARPEVDEVAFMVAPPLSDVSMFGSFSREDLPEPPDGEGPTAAYRVAGAGALEMLGIPIVEGRSLEASDRMGATPVVLISEEAAARYFPEGDPIGRQIDVNISAGYPEDAPRTVVGVFGDIRGSALTSAPTAEIIVPYAQSGSSFPNVLMRGSAPASILEASRTVLRDLDPELPVVQAGPMEAWVQEQLAPSRFYLSLLGVFAFLAILLAAVGMYGIVAYMVSQRRWEIGVRMALGARMRQVVQLVLWQGMRPALVGITVGLTGSLWATALIRGLLYEVAPQDPLTFAVVPVALVLVVIAACAAPARQATRIPPAAALRSDA